MRRICLTSLSAEAFPWLEKVLASRSFCRAPRLSRFLRFLVEHARTQSAGALKEYTIGVDVFDRDPSYDSRVDPIVRVEARRLRQKLKEYYAGEGSSDRIRIELPDRGYVPEIRYLSEPERAHLTRTVPSPSISIAVLPFTGIPNPSFARGLTDEVVHHLSTLQHIQILSGVTAMQLGLTGASIGAFRRPLNVDYVLTGSVRRDRNKVRLCVQLSSPDSGLGVASHAYEVLLTGIFETQKQLAAQIACDVQSFAAQPRTPLPANRTSADRSAHALYSEGRMLLNSRTRDGINQSIHCFRQLISTAPQFALAYAGLADAYSLGARYDVFPYQESWERARSAALDALRIDYSLAEAHSSLGFVDLHYRRDWRSAEREFCTAILLNPAYAPARQWYGWLLAATGHPDMAITAVKQAVGMDPLSPNANADLALSFYFSRQFDEALAQSQRTLALQPGFYRAHQLSGLAHLQKGDLPHAVEHLESAVTLTNGAGKGSVLLASALVAMGKVEEAHRVFARSIQTRDSKPSALEFALFSSALGDLDSVFQWLERAFEEQDAELLWLSVDPIYDKLRQDPRFSALLSKIAAPPSTHRLHELVLI